MGCCPARLLSMGFLRQEYWCGLPFPPPASYFFCCSVAQLCPTLCHPWTAACQAFLSFAVSRSLLRLTSVEPVMPPNHLNIYCWAQTVCKQTASAQRAKPWRHLIHACLGLSHSRRFLLHNPFTLTLCSVQSTSSVQLEIPSPLPPKCQHWCYPTLESPFHTFIVLLCPLKNSAQLMHFLVAVSLKFFLPH